MCALKTVEVSVSSREGDHETGSEKGMILELLSLKNYESYEKAEHDKVERVVTH